MKIASHFQQTTSSNESIPVTRYLIMHRIESIISRLRSLICRQPGFWRSKKHTIRHATRSSACFNYLRQVLLDMIIIRTVSLKRKAAEDIESDIGSGLSIYTAFTIGSRSFQSTLFIELIRLHASLSLI